MTSFDENSQWLEDRQERNGCVGSLLVFVLLLFLMGAVISGQRGTGESGPAPVVAPAAGETSALSEAQATSERVETTPPSLVLPATLLPTFTAVPSPTATATKVPTLPPPLPTVTTVAGDVPVPAPPPLPTPQDNVSRTLKVPILMYHYVSSPPEDADVYRVDLSVEPAVFREQMTYLAANGYSTIDFYDLSLAITGKLELPPRPVIITLDDGYVDNYHQAFPILREFGFKATFFIVTEFIDNGYAGYMNWAMIEEMAAAGMRIESHSKTHPDLRGQEHDYLVWQILGSQETLAAHVGYTPRYFSYPSGQYDEATIAVLQALDFWGAVTTHSGKEHGFNDRYEWTRLRVRYTTVLPEFVDLIDPGSAVGGRLPGT
jgi:peptidoglycan/xylan/chitin deacetylase (PgdA/CDA1 family)